MYLEPWSIAIIALLFGFCAYFSRKQGATHGMTTILHILEREKIITITEDGHVARYVAFGKPKGRKKRVDINI